MRTKKFFISLLILSLAVMITPLASADLAAHAPIYIDGNSNFTRANGVASGSGTESDPYIIENLNISSTSGACINITNTDAYFIVRNCTLSGTSSTAVIVLNNVTNGRVEGNTVSGGSNGIYLFNSTNNTLINNTCNNNTYFGIALESSSDNTLTNNTCTSDSYGIYLFSSTNNHLTDNILTNNTYFGIYLESSSNNNITWNELMFNTPNAYDNTDAANLWEYNFYSDYTGPDSNRDRIGDIPYNITGGSNRDLHPLVDTMPPLAISSPLANGSTVAAGAFQFNASYSSIGPLPVSVRLLIDGVDATHSANVTATGISCSVTLSEGAHTITLLLTDAAGNTASESWMITASEAAAGGGADMTLVYVGIVAAVVILGAAAAYLAMRKR
ncbi:MAG: right-handed parallel beta-helix repeat-containing protein [Candidatus Methanosuratus sp.]|nr:right-handed parallel beta-helix repeat-containing protein [Candidatus Methanosuratincola sp.]